ncbi:aquaporin-4 [Trichonephila clavata]|uniref:Aquaporin-4 n=1 Tax=Trichonephila clavata TaxID=2740835 RepID=A0A8X6HGU2_TRICU|nr:aquaporin-4 [Trichonephila clavata]
MRRYIDSLPQDLTLREELTDQHFWKAVRTEFLATLLLTVLGCGSCLRWKAPPTDQITASAVELRVALAFGLGVATLVQCVGQVSGGHMNPAVTIALLVTRHISVARTAAYVLAQCLGGLAGAGILYGLTPGSKVECRTWSHRTSSRSGCLRGIWHRIHGFCGGSYNGAI